MRLILAALLTSSLLCTMAMAAENPATDKLPIDSKAAPDKATPDKPAPAKPLPVKPLSAKTPANRPVDYGDMRCGFAVRHREVLDGQIVAWAGGFIEGYAKANSEHGGNMHNIDEITDPAVLRTHIRGFCLRHREKSVEAAVLALLHRTHGPQTTPALGPHPPVR